MENFKDSAEICRDFSSDPVLQQLLRDAPIAGARYRGIRVEALFTPTSEITTNAEKYNGHEFACIISVNNSFHAVGHTKDNSAPAIVPEIDHSVVYEGKVIFAGIA